MSLNFCVAHPDNIKTSNTEPIYFKAIFINFAIMGIKNSLNQYNYHFAFRNVRMSLGLNFFPFKSRAEVYILPANDSVVSAEA